MDYRTDCVTGKRAALFSTKKNAQNKFLEHNLMSFLMPNK